MGISDIRSLDPLPLIFMVLFPDLCIQQEIVGAP
jgi:hypothetical protein